MKNVKAKTKRTKPTPKTANAPRQSAAKKPTPTKILLVYGYGADGKPRAAAFGEPDHKLARKAAGLLGMKVSIASAADLKGVLKGVRSGNVYAPGGDGFAPKIADKRFAELLVSLGLDTPRKPAPTETTRVLAPTWEAIEVGHTVMGQADDPAAGYWPAKVEAVDGDDLRLLSLDFPDVVVTRNRFAVALPYTPGFKPYSGPPEASAGLPVDWDTLRPEHLVIAAYRRAEGSFEALVVRIDGENVTLKWRDSSGLPAFTRSRETLALLYPAAPTPAVPETS